MPTISFKVTDRQAARIRELARRQGVSLSEYLRRRATEPAPPAGPRDYRITTDPVTGLPVMEALPDTPEVTSAHVRALLADFP